MPTRIYALAKDLKLDSKELVDLCTKAGIPGKGSALASLEDDEVVKLKAFLDGHGKRPAAPPSNAPAVNVKAVLTAPVSTTTLTPPPPPRPSPVGRARPGATPLVETPEAETAVAVAEPPVVVAEEKPAAPVVKQPAPVAKTPSKPIEPPPAETVVVQPVAEPTPAPVVKAPPPPAAPVTPVPAAPAAPAAPGWSGRSGWPGAGRSSW